MLPVSLLDFALLPLLVTDPGMENGRIRRRTAAKDLRSSSWHKFASLFLRCMQTI